MPDDLSNRNKEVWTKVMFGVLVFFGISTLILGVLRISQTINSPLSEYNQGDIDFSAGLEGTERSVDELRAADTDGDGLSDFDELYVYGTSMYLADSDSDGYDDKSEIDSGYDPNCPKGMDCRGAAATNGGVTETEPIDGLDQASGQETLPTEFKDELKDLTPDEIRQLLLASGQITQAELDKIDDQTLMTVMQEILNQ